MHFQIIHQNRTLLFQARVQIDGPFKTQKGIDELSEEVMSYVERDDRVAYVYIKNDRPVGYVEVKKHEDDLPPGCPPLPLLRSYGHVARIGVYPAYVRRGIGSELLQAAEHWLMSANCPGMWLDHYSDNIEAAGLYAKFGFAELAEFDDPTKNPPRKRKVLGKIW